MAHFEAKRHTLIVENINKKISNFKDLQKPCESEKFTKKVERQNSIKMFGALKIS